MKSVKVPGIVALRVKLEDAFGDTGLECRPKIPEVPERPAGGLGESLCRQPAASPVLSVVEVHRPQHPVDANPGQEPEPPVMFIGVKGRLLILIERYFVLSVSCGQRTVVEPLVAVEQPLELSWFHQDRQLRIVHRRPGRLEAVEYVGDRCAHGEEGLPDWEWAPTTGRSRQGHRWTAAPGATARSVHAAQVRAQAGRWSASHPGT